MANLTSANVRNLAAWTEGHVTGKRRTVQRVELYDVTVGGTTNLIPASAFGMSVIEESTAAYDRQAGGVVTTAPSHDGERLFLYPTPDGSTGPSDVATSDTPNGLYLTVKGY